MSHYAEQSKDPDVLKIVIADWLLALEPYPFYAIEQAARVWLTGERGRYRPQISDITALAKSFSGEFRLAMNGAAS